MRVVLHDMEVVFRDHGCVLTQQKRESETSSQRTPASPRKLSALGVRGVEAELRLGGPAVTGYCIEVPLTRFSIGSRRPSVTAATDEVLPNAQHDLEAILMVDVHRRLTRRFSLRGMMRLG